MTKSATEVMQEILFAAVIDSITALKAASKGMPNTLLRDINAVHPNTTFADLPKDLQASISASVRAAFTRLLKEGYSVSSGQAAAPRTSPPNREAAAPGRRSDRPPPKRDGRGPRRPEGTPRPPTGKRPPRRP